MGASGMKYEVQIVSDADLPEGIHKVIVERTDGLPVLFINGEPARCWQFVRTWEFGYHEPEVPSVAIQAKPLRLVVDAPTGWQALSNRAV